MGHRQKTNIGMARVYSDFKLLTKTFLMYFFIYFIHLSKYQFGNIIQYGLQRSLVDLQSNRFQNASKKEAKKSVFLHSID